ncbi:hypothetical protein PG994_015092 [Apiospora phragmitis]|uniref:Uncharacterized protein n=1 Tax=Apiospora phragmitis TaxID=2905665 RepID=A0ABR1SVH6_9PEZI
MHPDMRSHQNPWHVYRAAMRGMPYRGFYGGGSPLLRLAVFGAGSYFIAKYVVRWEVSKKGKILTLSISDEFKREALRQQQEQPVRCSDCSNKIEAATDSTSKP